MAGINRKQVDLLDLLNATPADDDTVLIIDTSDGLLKRVSRQNLLGATLSELEGVSASAVELNILDGVTATTEELNILDGVTATTEELNVLDGVTSTTEELNILDGVTSTTEELNILDGVTSTTEELNKLDGVIGDVVGTTDTQTLTNKTISNSTIIPRVWYVDDGTDRAFGPFGDTNAHDITGSSLTVTLPQTCDVLIEWFIVYYSNDDYGFTVTLARDGTGIKGWGSILRPFVTNQSAVYSAFHVDENVTSGTKTYKLQGTASGNTAADGVIYHVGMKATIVDKQ